MKDAQPSFNIIERARARKIAEEKQRLSQAVTASRAADGLGIVRRGLDASGYTGEEQGAIFTLGFLALAAQSDDVDAVLARLRPQLARAIDQRKAIDEARGELPAAEAAELGLDLIITTEGTTP